VVGRGGRGGNWFHFVVSKHRLCIESASLLARQVHNASQNGIRISLELGRTSVSVRYRIELRKSVHNGLKTSAEPREVNSAGANYRLDPCAKACFDDPHNTRCTFSTTHELVDDGADRPARPRDAFFLSRRYLRTATSIPAR